MAKHNPKGNTNCLEGMQCPECGSYEPFLISVCTTAEVYDNGTEDTGDMEWDKDSECTCKSCDHSAKVRDFLNE